MFAGRPKLAIALVVLLVLALLVACIVAVVLGIGWYNASRQITTTSNQDQNSDDAQADNQADDSQESVSLLAYEIQTAQMSESSEAYEVDIQYPQISGLADADIEANFNQFVFDSINQLARDVKFTDPGEAGPNSIQLDYTVEYNSPNMISLMISGQQYMGGAHGLSVFIPINYDLVGDKQFFVDDVFSAANYLTKLSTLSRSSLEDMLGADADTDTINGGTTADANNFALFVVGQDHITITFGDYQVGPYAVGPQEVSLDFSDVGNLSTYMQGLLE